MTRILPLAALLLSAALVTACEDVSGAIDQVDQAAATAREATEKLQKGAELAERAAEDPAGLVRDTALGARFTRTATAEGNLFVLTDIATGCQYLVTYAPDGDTIQYIAPRTGADGQQRCVAGGVGGVGKAPDAASLVGKTIGAGGR